jgi:apolipoprotein N-acyltransferase
MLAFSFPSVDWNWLAWAALVPLLWMLEEALPREAFRLGWITGLTFYLGTLYWLVYTIGTFSPIPYVVAVIPLLLLCAVLAVYHGAFAAGVVFAGRRGLDPVVFAPLWWVGLEWLRSWLGIGFPWASLGYSQYRSQNLIQIAELTGVYGLSALIVLFNTVLATIVSRRGTTAARAVQLLVLSLMLVAVQQFGVWRLGDLAARETDFSLRAAVVQGNVPQHHKWNPAYQETTIATYARLSEQAAERGIELIVWPETAAPFFFHRDGPLADAIRAVGRDTRAWLLFGSPATVAENTAAMRMRNRAYLLSPDGETAGFYDKVILVPFGEYVPLRRLLFFADKMVDGLAPFSPGEAPRALGLGRHRLGVLICYEAIFPWLARELVTDGANLLVGITNDAWFGPTSAPFQHLAMASLRAVENRVPLLRAANTGISAIIRPDGAIEGATELFEPAVRVADLAWPAVDTVYRRFGDVFAATSLLCSSAMLLASVRWRRRLI